MQLEPLTHCDFCSGIGGFSLAAQWAGFRTLLHCEIDPYCRKVLAKNFAGVPCHDDLHTFTAAAYPAAVRCGLVTAGIPCQPFSLAGKRLGTADDRHLWPEMRRVLSELEPRWVVIENVGGFTDLALDLVLAGLEADGYAAGSIVLPVAGVGAPHQRHRCFIVARANEHADEQLLRWKRCDEPGDVGEEPAEARGDGEGALRGPAPRSGADTLDAEILGWGTGRAGRSHSGGAGQPEQPLQDTPAADSAPLGWERAGATWSGRDGSQDGGANPPHTHGVRQQQPQGRERDERRRTGDGGSSNADTDRTGLEGYGGCGGDWRGAHQWLAWSGGRPLESIWESEPAVCGMDDELPAGLDGYHGRLTTVARNRAKRIMALGNALPPMLVHPILAAIAAELRAPNRYG